MECAHLPETVPLLDELEDASKRGVLFGIIISSQHEVHRSVTVHILHGTQQGKFCSHVNCMWTTGCSHVTVSWINAFSHVTIAFMFECVNDVANCEIRKIFAPADFILQHFLMSFLRKNSICKKASLCQAVSVAFVIRFMLLVKGRTWENSLKQCLAKAFLFLLFLNSIFFKLFEGQFSVPSLLLLFIATIF